MLTIRPLALAVAIVAISTFAFAHAPSAEACRHSCEGGQTYRGGTQDDSNTYRSGSDGSDPVVNAAKTLASEVVEHVHEHSGNQGGRVQETLRHQAEDQVKSSMNPLAGLTGGHTAPTDPQQALTIVVDVGVHAGLGGDKQDPLPSSGGGCCFTARSE